MEQFVRALPYNECPECGGELFIESGEEIIEQGRLDEEGHLISTRILTSTSPIMLVCQKCHAEYDIKFNNKSSYENTSSYEIDYKLKQIDEIEENYNSKINPFGTL